jgi:hypothetical protein
MLIRRLKSHFITLPCGVDVILGLNGFIWVMKGVEDHEQEGQEGFDGEGVYRSDNDVSVCWSLINLSSMSRFNTDHKWENKNGYLSCFQYHPSARGAFHSALRRVARRGIWVGIEAGGSG